MTDSTDRQSDQRGAAPASVPRPDCAPTVLEEPDAQAEDRWLEATDGCCSESAALFAESQPAELNVV